MSESSLSVAIQPQVDELIAHYKTELLRQNVTQRAASLLAADGTTNIELLTVNWSDILTRFMASLQSVLGAVNGTPEQKRAAAIAAGVQFYKTAVRPILVQAIGGSTFLFDLFIGPALDKLVPGIVAGLYDGLVKIVPAGTIPTSTAPVPPGTPAPTIPPGFVPY